MSPHPSEAEKYNTYSTKLRHNKSMALENNWQLRFLGGILYESIKIKLINMYYVGIAFYIPNN